jgi:hypothetical protein
MRTHTRLSKVMAEWAAKAVPPPPPPLPPDPAIVERLARLNRQERREEALASAPAPPAWRMQMRVYENPFGAARFSRSLADEFDPEPGPPPGLIDWSRRADHMVSSPTEQYFYYT